MGKAHDFGKQMATQFHPLHRAYAAYGMQAPEASLNDNAPKGSESPSPMKLEKALDMAGVAPEDASPQTRKAVSSLFSKISELQDELDASRSRLRDLEAQADVDYVTGLPNRRAFFHRLDWSLSMLERYGHNFSLICFDIMQLEAINHHLGHHAGDMAIRHVASILDEARRETDFLARIGNDTFVLILHNADERAASARGERIVQSVTNSHFLFGGNRLPVNVAYGAYGVDAKDDADSALHKADLAMRVHKEYTIEKAHTRLKV